MLTILTTTDAHQAVQDAIASVDRLNELVTVTQDSNTIEDLKRATHRAFARFPPDARASPWRRGQTP